MEEIDNIICLRRRNKNKYQEYQENYQKAKKLK